MATTTQEEIKVPKRKIKSIGSDPEKTAKAINLVYVNDTDPGIERVKHGEKFEYFFKGEKIKRSLRARQAKAGRRQCLAADQKA